MYGTQVALAMDGSMLQQGFCTRRNMTSKGSPKRVAIVEDQKATAWALAESLTEDGYETLTAGSSEEALEMGLDQCDVLITDLRLPGMNGIELMTRIKKGGKPLPSILITAYSSPDVLASARKAGAIRCFSKPFNVEDIKACLKKALEGTEEAPEAVKTASGRHSNVASSRKRQKRSQGSTARNSEEA